MKIYTVQSVDKYDYDFSVEIGRHGAFHEKEGALDVAKEEFKKLKLAYAKEIVIYSDKDDYPDEDCGGLYIEEDSENGYYCLSFGFEEHHERHTIGVDEWKLDD